ncbi:uncharacterized protein [Haliotis asinina]|uniref:uncharacterized protein n=1 Tax=Haliotis asinina TaxID=109174 RepID=UPI003531D25C
MGCKQTKIQSLKQTCTENVLAGKHNTLEVDYAKSQVTSSTSRLSRNEVLQQLRDEGLVPYRQTSGGVAYFVPAGLGVVPRGKAPQRLRRAPIRGHYTTEEKQIIADVFRHDKLVEQVQRKQLDREIKHKAVKDEKKRREFVKKMKAEYQLRAMEEKLIKLEGTRVALKPANK